MPSPNRRTRVSCNSLENPIGIETTAGTFRVGGASGLRCNSLENPIGIETTLVRRFGDGMMCCNSLENPIGIETPSPGLAGVQNAVATHWKTR